MLIAFNTSHTLHTKGHSRSEKTYSNFIQNFYFPNAQIWIKVLCNGCMICQSNKPYPNQKQKNMNLKDKVYILITEYHLTQVKKLFKTIQKMNQLIQTTLDGAAHK